MKLVARSLLLFALVLAPAAWAADTAPARAAHPDGAAIASGHSLATQAGMEILGKGGNAFDAAVAVSSTLAVVEPISSGLGGGGFFLLHDAKTGKDVMLDARETSPESATPDQFLDKKNIAGFVINAMKSNTKSNLGTNTWNKLYINGDLANTTTTRNDGKDSYGYINANLNYTHIIRDGDEFTINADWGNYDIDKDADQKNTSISPDGGIMDRHRFRTNSEQGINIYSLRVDHQQKILGKLIGEAGFKWARSITDNNLLMENLIDGFWQKDNGQSSLFSYNEDITALYATLAGQAGTKWNFKGGLRAEHTSSKGEWISAGTSTSANYIDLFPTLFAGYNPSADLRLGLSYSTRIKRPNFRQMNPFRMYIDASSSIEGNPELTPEKTNTFSLSAGYKNHFNLALTGQFTKNVIIQSPFIDTQSGERIIKWDNFGKQSFAGASISASEYPLSSWLTFNGNLFIAQVSNKS